MKKPPAAQSKIVIQAPDLRLARIKVNGLSPLIVHRFSEKAIRQIEQNQSGAPKTKKRPPRNPQEEYEASMYRMGKDFAFPCAAFKQAAVSACRLVDGITMTQAQRLFVLPDELAKLNGKTGAPEMDTRFVRLDNGSADVRYRAKFWPWQTVLTIRYNAGAVSIEQLVNLFVLAGECIGVGELRPEKGGNHGRFTVG